MLCSLRRRLHYCYGGKLGTRSAWLYLRVRVLLYSTNSRRHFSKLHSRTLAKVFRTTDLLEANWCTQKQQRERKSVAQRKEKSTTTKNTPTTSIRKSQHQRLPKSAKIIQSIIVLQVETANWDWENSNTSFSCFASIILIYLLRVNFGWPHCTFVKLF